MCQLGPLHQVSIPGTDSGRCCGRKSCVNDCISNACSGFDTFETCVQDCYGQTPPAPPPTHNVCDLSATESGCPSDSECTDSPFEDTPFQQGYCFSRCTTDDDCTSPTSCFPVVGLCFCSPDTCSDDTECCSGSCDTTRLLCNPKPEGSQCTLDIECDAAIINEVEILGIATCSGQCTVAPITQLSHYDACNPADTESICPSDSVCTDSPVPGSSFFAAYCFPRCPSNECTLPTVCTGPFCVCGQFNDPCISAADCCSDTCAQFDGETEARCIAKGNGGACQLDVECDIAFVDGTQNIGAVCSDAGTCTGGTED